MDNQPTREQDKASDKNNDASRRSPEASSNQAAGNSISQTASDMVNGTMEMARNVGEQARAAAANPVATAQDLARKVREQTGPAADTLYQQGARAGEYLTRNVNEYPLTALLVAGAIGYGMAYLFHSSWQSQDADDKRG